MCVCVWIAVDGVSGETAQICRLLERDFAPNAALHIYVLVGSLAFSIYGIGVQSSAGSRLAYEFSIISLLRILFVRFMCFVLF